MIKQSLPIAFMKFASPRAKPPRGLSCLFMVSSYSASAASHSDSSTKDQVHIQVENRATRIN